MTYQGYVKEDFPQGTQFYYGIDIVEIIYRKTKDKRNKVIDYWDLSKITSFEPFAVHMRQADDAEFRKPNELINLIGKPLMVLVIYPDNSINYFYPEEIESSSFEEEDNEEDFENYE